MTENCFKFARATTTAGRGADICTTTREPFDRRSGRERRNGGAVQRGFVFCRSPFRISSLPDFSSVSQRGRPRDSSSPSPLRFFPFPRMDRTKDSKGKRREKRREGRDDRPCSDGSLQRASLSQPIPVERDLAKSVGQKGERTNHSVETPKSGGKRG